MSAPARSEGLRKAVHVACGAWALTFRWLPWTLALALALAAVAFGAFGLPRLLGERLHRPSERARGWSPAILFYAISVAVLIVIFRDALAFAAVGWGLMAFGDGAATLVGRRFGRHPLPWNAGKSWEGIAAFVAFGGAGAVALALFVERGRWDAAALVAGCAIAAVACAFVETLDVGIDDNITVPLLGGGIAWLVATLVADDASLASPASRVAIAGAACVLLGLLAAWRGTLTRAGAACAALVGAVVAGAAGWAAFAALAAFFVLGTGATRLGRATKERRGIAEARGGRRGVGNVVANGGVAAACALLVALGPAHPAAAPAWIALLAALATAAMDTVSSEIGKAFGRRTWLVTTLRRVPPGTEGALSLEGTAAGVASAGLVVVAAWAAARSPPPVTPTVAAAVVLGAIVGTTFESIVGALVESRGHRIQNDAMNFANTIVGALAAVALAAAMA